ncbi:MAG: hypothetical protein WCP69_12400 [Bacteroidota bacterium]
MKNVILSTVIIFVINLFLQIFVSQFSNTDKGLIITSEPIKEDSIHYIQTMIVSNYEQKTINNLEFIIENAEIESIYTSNKCKIKQEKNKLCLLELYPKANITIYLSLVAEKNLDGNPNLIPLNNLDHSIKYVQSSELKRASEIPWIGSIILSGLVSLIYYLIAFYLYLKFTKIQERLTETSKKLTSIQDKDIIINENHETKLSNIENKMRKIEASSSKIRLLLLTRIRDLKKENDFYREIIKDVAKKTSEAGFNIKEIFELVTDKLKTYSTRANIEKELSQIDVIASILKNNSKQND